MLSSSVLISEVGPRDGLQSVKATMPTADKLAWISGLHAAGLREIEVCSFVPATLLPQMADAAEVVARAVRLPSLTTTPVAQPPLPACVSPQVCMIETYKERQQNAVKQREARRRYLARRRAVRELQWQVGVHWVAASDASNRA